MNNTRTQRTHAPRRDGKVISIRDARARRVQALKALVRSGRYEPALEKVADALLTRGVVSPERTLESPIAWKIDTRPN